MYNVMFDVMYDTVYDVMNCMNNVRMLLPVRGKSMKY